MEKLFIDTDIALDLLSGHQAHYVSAATLFTLANNKRLELCVSALTFENLNYILTKQYSGEEARTILSQFKGLVDILSVNERVIDLSLKSRFSDFEDAIQYHTAIENGVGILITRNLKAYKHAGILVMTARDYLLTI